jgi:hypothetical protein
MGEKAADYFFTRSRKLPSSLLKYTDVRRTMEDANLLRRLVTLPG